jgi:metal-responsive CopG/Arc/MetJ family transcriptional regulator
MKEPATPPTQRVSVRLPSGILAKVDGQADGDARTRSNMIAVLLREALDARAEAAREPKP